MTMGRPKKYEGENNKRIQQLITDDHDNYLNILREEHGIPKYTALRHLLDRYGKQYLASLQRLKK